MSAGPLLISTPAEQGMDTDHLQHFLDGVELSAGVELHSLMILRHGAVVAEGWWAPYRPEQVHHVYSLSKSFTSAAIGLAVAEGLVGLDDPMIKFFPEFDTEVVDRRTRSILVRHLLAMASGHSSETWSRVFEIDPVDPARGFLLLPPDHQPGTVFAYNQSCSYLLSAIVQQATGQTLTEFLRPRLLDPLGIGEFAWVQVAGRDAGAAGLHTTTDAIARLGQLHLQRGRWNGQQLLPEEWVAEATRLQISSDGPSQDWQQGYGFQFWRSQHGYRGDGVFGQLCLVLPDQDAVVAATAATADLQSLLDLVWTRLLPAFEAGAGSTGRAAGGRSRDDALRERLSRLELPAAQGSPAPPANRDEWTGAVFHPAGGSCDAQPDLSAIELKTEQKGWRITATDDGTRYPLLLRTGGWNDGPADAEVPVAVSGGWTDAATLTFDVVFLETPHRLAVRCDLRTHTFHADWHTTPPGGFDFDELRSPA